MAKQIEELLIRLKTEGYEEVTKLKSAFRGLESALGQSDEGLSEIREGLLDLANKSQRSEALIKGLESAFKSLRSQAELQSPLYKQLGNDIDGLGRELAQLSTRYETVAERATQAATAQQNAANAAARNRYLNRPTERYQPLGARVAVEPTAYDEAIAAINEVNARASGTIASLEEQRSAWERLRRVVDPTSDAFRIATQNVKTLQAGLDRLAISQKKVTQVTDDAGLSALDKAKKVLDEVVSRSDSTIGSLQEQASAWTAVRNALDPASASFVTATRRITELRKRLDALKVPQQATQPDVKTVNTAYEKALADLRDVKRVSNDSIQSLNAQKNAWTALRNAVSPSSEAFANATKQVEQLTKQLDGLAIKQEKVNKTTPRRFSARQAAEVAGAAISGGIFGGPEGFLGGVAGGALGGVGGAFAGAAIGAQVAGLRQAAGAAAEYAAAINQQRRALEGVVESNAAYQQSLAFIDQTSRQLAIPQEQVTRNFTRLSASVLGAGGNVDAAQEAFMGIAAGIRGTGGSLADLDAALLATAQVFSKGKVSAEEIRGQIGERLPGAFNLLATAIGKTPQELDKMLEKGEVTLNDFMAFIRLLVTDYGIQSVKMAASSEAAGDRLQTAFGRIQEAIGKAFQPVGAEFQETLSRFVLENEQALVNLAQALADAGKGFLDFVVAVGPALVELGKFALAFGAATLATKAFTVAGPYVVAALRLMGVQFVATSALVDAAQKRLVAFGGTVKALAASLAVPIVLTIAIVGAGVVIDWLNKIKDARDRLRKAQSDIRGDAWVQSIGGQSQSLQQLQQQVQAAGNTYQYLADKIKAAREELASTPFKPRKEFLAQQIAADEAQLAVAESRYRAGIAALGRKQASIQPSGAFQFPSPAAEAAGAAKEKKGPKPPEDRTRELQAELELFQRIANQENAIRDALFKGEDIRAAQLETGKKQLQIMYERNRELRAANYESEKEVIRAFALEKIEDSRRQLADRIREIENAQFQTKLQNQQALRDAIEPLKQAKEQQELQLKNTKEYTRLVMEGVLPSEAERIINWQNLVAQQVKSLDTQIQITEEQIAQAELKNQELGKEQIATKDLRDKLALLRRQREGVQTQAQAGPGRGQTEAEKVEGAIGKIQGELNELTSISTQLVTHANAIGDAFSEAFIKLITGAGSARQVLSDFFQSVAKSFLDMAAQIIAKQITMLILQTALKALGAVSGASAAPGANIQSGADFNIPGQISTGMTLTAKGAAYGPQGPLEMFSRGGVVTSPTPFRFAKGGGFAPGLMAEAGPEAILPLQRGPDGRLGVSIYDASRRAVASAENAAAANAAGYADEGMELGGGMTSADRRASLAATSAAAVATRTQVTQQQLISEKRAELREFQQMLAQPARLDVEFKSQVINNVEYVTKEQAERMAAQSAVRGREMTLNALQTSVKTRKRVGMGR